MTRQVDRRVDVPMHNVTLLEFLGLAFNASMILENEFEDGRRTPLDKIDRYFYKKRSSLLGNNDRFYIPFK